MGKWRFILMRTIIGKADAASLRCRENINRVVKDMHEVVGDHSFSTFANVLKKLSFVTPWYARVCAYQGVRNVSFSENFAYILNDWSFNIIKAYIYYSCVLIVVDFKQLLFYLFKLNNGNTRIKCEFCSKLVIKTPERRMSNTLKNSQK